MRWLRGTQGSQAEYALGRRWSVYEHDFALDPFPHVFESPVLRYQPVLVLPKPTNFFDSLQFRAPVNMLPIPRQEFVFVPADAGEAGICEQVDMEKKFGSELEVHFQRGARD